jgi:hypothetical protein
VARCGSCGVGWRQHGTYVWGPSAALHGRTLLGGGSCQNQLRGGYRWPFGTNMMGRHELGPKKHGPGTTRHDGDSASAGHDTT